MNKILSMADLLAKQQVLSLQRGQELDGEVVDITPQEIILDLGTKAEGVLPKKELSDVVLADLKIGSKLSVVVIYPENESGQVILTSRKSAINRSGGAKWDKFQKAIEEDKTLAGKGVEVNKGGLIVEIGETRGFLPASQVSLSQASNLDDLIGKEILVNVIEVDPSQNRLIFSHKATVSEQAKKELGKLKIGDKVSGKVAAVLPFGAFISLPEGIEGLVHISEVSWEKVEDPSQIFKIGMEVESQVISIDQNTTRVNLSIKHLSEDPFLKISEKYTKDDVVKGTVSKISNNGIIISLEAGAEGLIPTSKVEQGVEYQVGQEIQCLVDNIDTSKRRIYLAPFLTSTKGLIYK